MEISNNALAVLVIAAMVVSIAGTMSMLSIIPRQPIGITGMQTTTQAGIANATLSPEVHIELVDPAGPRDWSLVEFHDIQPGDYNDTADMHPHPFRLRNNGSVVVNVSIAEATATGSNELWNQDDTCESCFQFNATPNGTSGAVSYASWTNFAGSTEAANTGAMSTDPATLVYNLTTDDTGDARDIYVHLNITPPGAEASGVKEATILFLAGQG
jgi:hypothetical protein